MNKLTFSRLAFFLFLINAVYACQSEIVLQNPPSPGDYFVFDGLLDDMDILGEQVLKVESVSQDSVLFLIPEIELAFEFAAEKDEKLIKAADKKGQMYKKQKINVHKKDLATYEQNFEKDIDGIALIAVFY